MEESCSHPTAEHYMVPFDKRPCQEGTHGPKGQSKSKELTLILHDKAPLMEENRCVHVLCVGALPGSMESGGYGCRARGRPPNLFRPIEYCWTSDTSCASYASYRCVTRCATGYLFCNPVQYVERVAREHAHLGHASDGGFRKRPSCKSIGRHTCAPLWATTAETGR